MDLTPKEGKLQTSRIPGLDGWRGISIIIVILGHQIVDGKNIVDTSGLEGYFKWLTWHLYGVQVFFVISGFLITTLLMNELEKTKRISLKNFYIRRVFRIIPAYYLYLLTVFIITRIDSSGEILTAKDWIKSLLFISNFKFWGISWTLGHSWSLSVEEQFYLIWPLIFCLPGLRKIVPIIFICLAPVARVLNYKYHTFGEFSFWVHCDAIFIGALFAMQKNREWCDKYKYLIVGASAILLFCERAIIPYSGFATIMFSRTLFSVAVVCLIYQSFKPQTFLYKFMNMKGLVFVGLISYSLYLWQQLFFPASVLGHKMVTFFPINMVIIAILAYISYRFIETPLIRWRKKLFPHS